MQQRLAETQARRFDAQLENRATVAVNGLSASASQSAVLEARSVNAPARAVDRGPLDIVFASTTTIILWVVIVALVKWLS
jgi:hypothetical protein